MKSVLILLLSLTPILIGAGISSILEASSIEITILYDNYVFSEGTEADWGFSCIIKGTEKNILFDTGTSGGTLFHNIDKLKVNPKDVELVAISHLHRDHTGGLFTFLEKNNKVTTFLPASFPAAFKGRVKKSEAKVVSVSKPVEICKNVFSTGEMGTQIKEQSLILNTSKGLVVITGCAHPGIVDIVKRAKEMIDKNIYLVFGGFHLMQKSEVEVKNIISQFKDLGVEKVGATHCTGERAIQLFKQAYGDDFVQMGVGRVIKISD